MPKSLGSKNPELSAQWHPTRNGDLTPFDVTTGSNKKVWWKCQNGPDHEWDAVISSRSAGRGCSFCSKPAKRLSITNCLATVRPDIAVLWHPTKNGNTTPRDVLSGSDKRFWFNCEEGPDHEWECKLNNLTSSKNRGCPCCAGTKVSITNSLASLYPELLKEWHPTKNGNLKPDELIAGATTRVWWKCPEGPDHEWDTYLYSRTNSGTDCPYCSGQKVSVTNSLETLFPKLAKEWHPTKNGELKPDGIVAGATKKVWWICDKGPDHEWDQAPSVRTGQEVGCPQCHGLRVSVTNSLATQRVDVAELWHPSMNGGLTPHDVVSKSNKKFWWKCSEGPDHEWESSPNGIHPEGPMSNGCPFCSSRRLSITNSLANLNPRLSEEWDFKKNGDLTPSDVVAGSGKVVWWKCPEGPDHEWRSSVNTRSYKDSVCPFCANRKVSITNSLASIAPHLISEWHPTKNGDLTPDKVTSGSHKKVWWRCEKGPDHEWKTQTNQRVRVGTGCPCCENLQVSITNNLEVIRPELLEIWDYDKNAYLPSEIVAYANKKVWWKCPEGPDHEWRVSPAYVGGCPCCAGQKISITNCLATRFPKLADEWHPTKNGPLTPRDVLPFTKRKVWWQCPDNSEHRWKADISNRSNGKGCSQCTKKNQRKLFKFVCELFAGNEVMFDYRHPELRFSESNLPMELDIWLPDKMLAFEYQGEQHFAPFWKGVVDLKPRQTLEATQKRDQEKREACEVNGIILIEVPYTWKGTMEWLVECLNEHGIVCNS
jgi:hypothetical protein